MSRPKVPPSLPGGGPARRPPWPGEAQTHAPLGFPLGPQAGQTPQAWQGQSQAGWRPDQYSGDHLAGDPAAQYEAGNSGRGYADAAPPQLSVPRGPQQNHPAHWNAPGGYPEQPPGGWQRPDPYANPATDDLGYAAFGAKPGIDAGYSQSAYGHPGGEENVDGFAQEQAYYEAEEPRGRGWMVWVVCALAGAIAVGGGLAYAYRTMLGSEPSVATPVVRGDESPTRAKPPVAGGKEFANTDSKVMGRLSGDEKPQAETPPEAQSAAATEETESGARKVTTFMVGRNGEIVPPRPEVEAPVSTVPGLQLDNGFGTRPPARVASREEPAAPVAAGPPAPGGSETTTSSLPDERPLVVKPPAERAKAPTVISKAEPAEPPPAARPDKPEKPVAEESAKSAIPVAEEEAPAPRKPAAPPKRVAALPAPASPAAAPTGAGEGGGASGYVAVVASVPASASSRMDALKQFADMQQKYGAVLTNRTPDVREANLGEKGTYHRLLVGPPGSRDEANAVCSGLKSAGYASCWITAY